eukprot:814873-Rhodomonas_salina.1
MVLPGASDFWVAAGPMVLRGVRVRYYAFSGTELVYGAMAGQVMGACLRSNAPLEVDLPSQVPYPYALPKPPKRMTYLASTAIPFAAGCLRACYVMPGTDIPHGGSCLRECCAMSGTELAYGGMQVWKACVGEHVTVADIASIDE